MGPEIVIALYRPKKGKATLLEPLVAQHQPLLRKAGLITERTPVLARSSDGTWLEIFEWKSAAAAAAAHVHPEVGALWEAMATVAEFPPLADLPESTRRFPHFTPVG